MKIVYDDYKFLPYFYELLQIALWHKLLSAYAEFAVIPSSIVETTFIQ